MRTKTKPCPGCGCHIYKNEWMCAKCNTQLMGQDLSYDRGKREMKALSIKQPWAWAIFHGKPVENRTWRSKYTGKLLIHAGKGFDHEGYRWLEIHRHLLDEPLPAVEDFQRGGIVGVVTMTHCTDYFDSPWFFGPYGFVFRDAKPVDFVSVKGKLGFFNVPMSVEV